LARHRKLRVTLTAAQLIGGKRHHIGRAAVTLKR
jgi:hypothetical protein